MSPCFRCKQLSTVLVGVRPTDGDDPGAPWIISACNQCGDQFRERAFTLPLVSEGDEL